MIRFRLLVGFILVGLLPVLGVGVGTYILSYQNGKQQAIDRLESISARKELAIQVYIQTLAQELRVASQTDVSPKLVTNALVLSNAGESYKWYNDLVRKRLQTFVAQSEQLKVLFLVDLKGQVVVATNRAQEEREYKEIISTMVDNASGIYLKLPYGEWNRNFSSGLTPEKAERSTLMLLSVSGSNGKKIGYIGGEFKIEPLMAILQERTGLGDSGVAYLVNLDHFVLSNENLLPDDDKDQIIYTEGADTALRQKTNVKGVFKNPVGEAVIGIYRWMPDLQAVLSVEQDVREAFQLVFKNAAINVILATLALFFATGAALYMTRTIANPISNLAHTASQIAGGDLERIAVVQRNDEVGELAKAFNAMTTQLRDLISSLEHRVAERTEDLQNANQELQQRAIQLETSAKVARDITSILEIDQLLKRVVELIQGSFGYYHVQVFLLDREKGQLSLGASSGSRKVQHQHIPLDAQSINSQAIKTGVVQVVNDIQQNPYYLYDEGLPETRSELVIPLQVGGKLIGTLDVHSIKENAFTEKDLTLLQSLGDQIAIAIENARLYDQSRDLAILEERHRLARELHDSVTQSLYSLVLLTEGWRRRCVEMGDGDMENYLIRIGEIASQALKEMRLLILELRPPTLEQEGLVGALQKRLDAVEKRVGIKARVVMEEFYQIPISIEKELYWIAQEALNNSLRHAQATEVTVWIYVENGKLYLKISDDGIGFDVRGLRNGGGMGLANMHERAKRMGGEVIVDSALGEGTTVTAWVPFVQFLGEKMIKEKVTKASRS